jgi:hypothetical protein
MQETRKCALVAPGELGWRPPKAGFVRPSTSWMLVLFCLTAALVAAACADPIVEALSNAGVFGKSNYTDHSLLDVIPMLSIGAMSAALWLFVQVRKMLGLRVAKPQWIHRSAFALDARSVVKLLPAVFALQIVILFSMETLEQLFVYGHVLGPLVWLGGPVLVSLLAHAFACALVTFTLARVLRKCAAAVFTLARFIAHLFSRLRPDVKQTFVRAQRCLRTRFPSPIIGPISERAPPLSA